MVSLLWLCGFFNYADRQAVNAVLPLIQKEFDLTNGQLGMIGSAFMIVYALSAPLAGFLVDSTSRRVLISLGLAFWSLICAATGFARNFNQLLFFRAAEGLGESFYFPASMTILADYHSSSTRSRAMSIHQTSVYVGSAGGVVLAGFLGERFGWRSPFWALGLLGIVFAVWLSTQIVEPLRGQSEITPGIDPEPLQEIAKRGKGEGANLYQSVMEVFSTSAAALLLLVFIGANFVAAAFMTWLTVFLSHRFSLGLTAASLTSTAWPLASLMGALFGGYFADRASFRPGGRVRVQAHALIVGAPFVLAMYWANTVPLVLVTLIGIGTCKGVYDANIFASLYDVIRPPLRGTAAGLMNTVGWTGGALAPYLIGRLSESYGLGPAIASTAAVYLIAGLLALVAAKLSAAHRKTEATGQPPRS
ncbi:MAG: MFS transporter [Isosphaeraceae bacterium]